MSNSESVINNLVELFLSIKKNYLIAIKKTKYRTRVEEMAKAESGKIRPVFSHLKNLIFLLITFAISLNTPFLKLLKD